MQGLDALAARAALLATAIGDGAEDAAVTDGLRRLERRVERSGVLRALRGVGSVDGALPEWAEHLRGDAGQRWRRWLAGIGAALRDGSPQPVLAGVVVDPDSDLLERLLVGATLTDAVATIVSLDLRIPLPIRVVAQIDVDHMLWLSCHCRDLPSRSRPRPRQLALRGDTPVMQLSRGARALRPLCSVVEARERPVTIHSPVTQRAAMR